MSNLAESLAPKVSLTEDIELSSIDTAVTQVKSFGNLFLGIGVLLCIFYFMFALYKLGASRDNEQARQTAIQAILTAGIALALLGGFGTVVGICLGLF